MEDHDLTYLVARILTCGIWAGAGFFKLFHFAGFTAKMRGFGFPLPALSAAFVIAVELVGSLFLVLNFQVWAVALVWTGFTVWASWIEHRHIFDGNGAIVFPEYVQVCKNISIIGGLWFMILLDTTRPEWLL
jgi:uncharacterized membrane protein YphA (DoxX/SURF4 family)